MPHAALRPPARAGSGPLLVIRGLTLAGIGLALGMAALGAIVLVDARRDAWQQASMASNNLASALERDIARNIATIDLSVQGVILALQRPGLAEASPEVRHMALFDRAANAEYLGALVVTDRTGHHTVTSSSGAAETPDLSDRDYFITHRDDPDAGLYLSRPFRSRMRGGDPTIAISRRINRPDGTFDGVAFASLRLAFFQDLFSRLDLGRGGAVSLLRTDGVLIAREPLQEEDLGRDLSRIELFRRMSAAPGGQFVSKAQMDGVERLYTFRRVGNLPLVTSLGLSVQDIYAPWWRKAWAMGSILVVLCASIVLLTLLFRREMLRRISAETALTEAAGRLAVMAATDGLTGLANRRQFDRRLEEEWRRAIRNGTPLSLLLLDADHFKAYNDSYGHQEGDQVLIAVARCIRDTVRRPADAGARYGGEEFAVLLPETDAEGARRVAELIRRGVEALDLPHVAHPLGRVTVSIGWASAYPQRDQPRVALVEEADRALYGAKRGGRNRISGVIPDAGVTLPGGMHHAV